MRRWVVAWLGLMLLGCTGVLDALRDSFDRQLDLIHVPSSGIERTAFVHVPRGSGPRPLVIVMHGGGPPGAHRGRRMARAWRPHYDRGIVLAFPNGRYAGERPPGSSRASPRPWHVWDDPVERRGTDLVFLRDLIDTLVATAGVDPTQVYLAGFSAGGGFTWFASCVDTEPFAGFGIVGMLMDEDLRQACAPMIKRPMITVHGEDDPTVPIAGTPMTGSWEDTARWLIDNRRCGRFPVAEPHIEAARGRRHACRTVREVELWRVEGAGHCWPGQGDCAGPDAGALMLDYWRRTAGFPSE